MDTKFVPSQYEESLYAFWEKNGYLKPKNGEPYTVLMPPPNANASLHAGHGMYTVDDIVIRYKRLRGFASVWLPGMDHAGIETQFVYEKKLAKEGKSRMDFDRDTLYENIFQFVKENSGTIYQQFKRLGFLADWDRSVFTLDDHVIQQVFETFQKMEKEKIIYRNNYMVSYCTFDGTSLAELEVNHVERTDPLYYMKYGPFVVATVRPETKFGDTAVAVHPDDTRYSQWIGKEIEVEGLNGTFKIKVIADTAVDPAFGTGVVKVTPAHDPNDFEMSKRHNLEIKQVIDITGRLTDAAGPYKGLKVKAARAQIAQDLQDKGLMEKIDMNYMHTVSVCYKCKRDVEPMIIPNWFLKVENLKKEAMNAVEKDRVTFIPQKYKEQIKDWYTIMHDWPISRQNVWGIRIPVWYKVTEDSPIWVWWIDESSTQHNGKISDFIKDSISLSTIKKGLQKIYVPTGDVQPEYVVSQKEPDADYIQETDTFDTWFSSGQWPLVTVHGDEYKKHYPTDFIGTLADILKFWISRMIMLSLYMRNEVPFKDVYLWSMVADAKGIKMSKSKGNVVNPLDYVEKYGADAFRASLIFGTAQGGQVNLAEGKVIGMRNFTNKLWNIGRFLYIGSENAQDESAVNAHIEELKKEYEGVKQSILTNMEAFKFAEAFGEIYEFIWHRYADYYIEVLKEEIKHGNIKVLKELKDIYLDSLVLLHPFMPFITEAVWQKFNGESQSILDSQNLK